MAYERKSPNEISMILINFTGVFNQPLIQNKGLSELT